MTVYLKERQWQHRWKIHKRSTLGVTTWKKALWRSHPATSTLRTGNGFLKEKTSHPEERKVTGETGAFRKGCKLSENIHPLEEYGLFSCITLQLTQTAVRLLLSIQPLFKLCLFPLWPACSVSAFYFEQLKALQADVWGQCETASMLQ